MHAEDAVAANRLLALSLDRGSLPGTDAEHRQLIVRFRTDPGYASTVRQIAEPLGLRVLGANQQLGLVLDPTVASPFSLRSSDLAEKFRWTSANERIIYGVAVVGVATFCYPTAESFKEPGVRQLNAVDVDNWIRQAAVSLQERDDHSGHDIAPADALAIYVAEKAVSQGKTKLRSDCTVHKIGRVLGWLADQGFLVQDKQNRELFRSNERFRLHVREIAANAAFKAVCEAMNSEKD